jgi:molybdopterin/thiamine biosynthesis adenylyltransferase
VLVLGLAGGLGLEAANLLTRFGLRRQEVFLLS